MANAKARGRVYTGCELPVTLRSALEGVARRDGVTLSDAIRRVLAAAVLADLSSVVNSDGSLRW